MSYFAITSNKRRHIQFLDTLRMDVPLSQIIVVPKDNRNDELTKAESDFWPRKRGIGNIYLMCDRRRIESDLVLNSLKKIKPKVGFIFGAPLLPPEIYDIPEHGCVNIHTGLVQHYRGVDSAYWALHENQLDKIGATLHYIDNSIDAGDIIDQKKVQIELNDTPDKLFLKSCQAGFDILARNMDDIVNNNVQRKKLLNKGKLYQIKDMTSDIMKEVNSNCREKVKGYLNENNR